MFTWVCVYVAEIDITFTNLIPFPSVIRRLLRMPLARICCVHRGRVWCMIPACVVVFIVHRCCVYVFDVCEGDSKWVCVDAK